MTAEMGWRYVNPEPPRIPGNEAWDAWDRDLAEWRQARRSDQENDLKGKKHGNDRTDGPIRDDHQRYLV